MPSQVAKMTENERAVVPILRLLVEQQAIQVDHLAALAGLYVFDVTWMAAKMERLGLVVVDELQAGSSPWIGVTARGARLSGLGLEALEPALKKLNHLRAINEARILLTSRLPQGTWICERMLWRQSRGDDVRRVPDAVFEVRRDDGPLERWAIEVELTRKKAAELRAVVAKHSRDYDAVVYLCSGTVARLMGDLKLSEDFPKLEVRELFELHDDLKDPIFRDRRYWCGKRIICRDAAADEVPVLNLLVEQGAIPDDQLRRFLELDESDYRLLLTRLTETGLVGRSRVVGGEPCWNWVTKRGLRFVTVDIRRCSPKLGTLSRLRLLNEVRLSYRDEHPDARWFSERVLRRGLHRRGRVPGAFVELGGPGGSERLAVEVCVATNGRSSDRIRRLGDEFGRLVMFCGPRARAAAMRMVDDLNLPEAEVRVIPGYRDSHYLDIEPRTRPYEPAKLDVAVKRLIDLVGSGQVSWRAARVIVGYLVFLGLDRREGQWQAAWVTREARKWKLLTSQEDASPAYYGAWWAPADVGALADSADERIAKCELTPSYARSILGFAVFGKYGVEQISPDLGRQYRKVISSLLMGAALGKSEDSCRPSLTRFQFEVASMRVSSETGNMAEIAAALGSTEPGVCSILTHVYDKARISGPRQHRIEELSKFLASCEVTD